MLVSMAKDPIERKRRLREGKEFLDYLRGRQAPAVSRLEPAKKAEKKEPVAA
jgi:hypothetical protein